MRPGARKKKDTRITGIVVIGTKRYAIKLIVFPRVGNIVEVMRNFYAVKNVKFKEVKSGMIPVIYLVKSAKAPKGAKKGKK